MTDDERRRLLAIFHNPNSSGLQRLEAAMRLKDGTPAPSASSDASSLTVEMSAELVARAEFVVWFTTTEKWCRLSRVERNIGVAEVLGVLNERGWYAIRPDIRKAWNEREVN